MSDTEMSGYPNPNARQDEAAVAAVREGDAERYRELVERHERHVYAVAWSRLGDAALAEEVTQECFIRAYRRLWLLGDGAKFGGWITAIARRLAINFGLRHRRELNKRERWALENLPATIDSATFHQEDPRLDPLHSPDVLRLTLGEIAPAHRECLVLFYLDGKSGAEAAEALGISESAFRVRLHRARAALRDRLGDKLEGSLAHLRPTKSLIPPIMAGVLAASSAHAAASGGIGAAILSGLTKLVPFKWAMGVLPAVLAAPVFLFSWLVYRSERRNYRDPSGFRVRILRRQSVRSSVWIAVTLATLFAVMRLTDVSGAKERLFLGIGVFNLLAWSSMYRQAKVNRSRYQLTLVATTTLTTICCFLVGVGLIPMVWFNGFLGLQLLLGALVHGQRPVRMDYNLFLRALEGMLSPHERKTELGAACGSKRFNREDLLAFARFLGSRWLADDMKWTPEGLELRLPPVDFRVWRRFDWFRAWDNQSIVLLAFDGTALAILSGRDHESLKSLSPQRASEATPEDLEAGVTNAVHDAWYFFRTNQPSSAQTALGQIPETEVFLRPLARSGLSSSPVRVIVLLLAVFVVLLGSRRFSSTSPSGPLPVNAVPVGTHGGDSTH